MATNNPYSNVSNAVHNAMDELSADTSQYVPNKPATELFRLDDSVQIFFVTSDGHVSTFSAPESLRIFRFDGGAAAAGELEGSPVFLQGKIWFVSSGLVCTQMNRR